MQKAVFGASDQKRQVALAEFAHLQRLERLTSQVTPLVFLLGLALAGALSFITGGHRRLLNVERARALHDSQHDALTGLPNRPLLVDRLGAALQVNAQTGTSSGLLLIDLDRFKEINDTFGHQYGDLLLNEVGARLRSLVAGRDTVARLGGDEFAVLLIDVGSLNNATSVAARLQAAMERPFHAEGVDMDIEASIGVVLSGQHGLDTTTLLRRVDIAMYVAKAQNLGVHAYEPDIDGQCPKKLALLGDLRRSLEHGELILYYQPKLNVSTGDVVGVEALVRWLHPVRGLVFPDEFIPLAERTGLIGPLTHHVLNVALAQARVWSDAGRPLTVSVNLSARNLLDESLPSQVASLLDEHGVAPDLLNLEVTESAIMTEPARAQRLLTELTTLGIRISLDDFGAGYTSLGQLKNLPISELKIDRSFVMTMTEDPSNALIVRSVIDLGHNLGLTLVAEGVETEQTLTALAGFGCDIAQGYHLSYPIPAADFDTWCARRRITPMLPHLGGAQQLEMSDHFSFAPRLQPAAAIAAD
jgi:diguanylate cyclase (GGDEF)-like protein